MLAAVFSCTGNTINDGFSRAVAAQVRDEGHQSGGFCQRIDEPGACLQIALVTKRLDFGNVVRRKS